MRFTARAIAFVSMPFGALSAQTTTHELPGASAAIYNLAGVLRVQGGSGEAIKVEVTRRGAGAGRLKADREMW